ncbi:MAG: guanylate kinase [Magnetococcales bacterium]|nr:guanylate kinase [Magnetococcales bacterium]
MDRSGGVEKMHKRGVALILSAPSGAGKTTLSHRMMSRMRNIQPSISTTTRLPRPGEVHGKDYLFTDMAQFKREVAQENFLEWAEVFGNCYGTSRESVESMLASGSDVVLDIDWQGARQVREKMADQDVVSIFIAPPSLEVLRSRLEARGQDDAEVINHRMDQASSEMSHWDEYDYMVVNDDLEQACQQLIAIIQAERLRTRRVGEVAQAILNAEPGGRDR